MIDTITFNSADDARTYSAEQGGHFYVLAPETLAQIEAAEAAGGFEGGMSGASGQGGFSAQGDAPNSSSAADAPTNAQSAWDPAEYDRKLAALVDGVIDFGLGIKDFVEALEKGSTGPVILIPMPELDKLLHGSTDET
ncbi:MAG: hypothetical protein HGA47_02225 [Zoogloea sp.]|nr:hypothetical protein [Zoogloea sp.]